MTGHSIGHHPTTNVPFMFERGQTLWIYLHLQIAGTKYSNDAASSWALRLDLKFSFPFSFPSICNKRMKSSFRHNDKYHYCQIKNLVIYQI